MTDVGSGNEILLAAAEVECSREDLGWEAVDRSGLIQRQADRDQDPYNISFESDNLSRWVQIPRKLQTPLFRTFPTGRSNRALDALLVVLHVVDAKQCIPSSGSIRHHRLGEHRHELFNAGIAFRVFRHRSVVIISIRMRPPPARRPASKSGLALMGA